MKFKNIITTVNLIAFLLITAPISAQDYLVDARRTLIEWEGKGVGKSHQGGISVSSGSLTLKDGLPVSGNIVIDMTSITNSDINSEDSKTRLINHLKSDDFFSVSAFPEANFLLKGTDTSENGSLQIKGDLTIKGRTHPVQFMADSGMEGDMVIFKGIIEVDRSLYDVRYGSGKFFDNLGNRAINDIFTLDFELAVKKSGTPD